MQFCQLALSTEICDLCNPGYTLISGRCLKVISSQSCPGNVCKCNNTDIIYLQDCFHIQLDHCNVYTNPAYCQACKPGYVAIGGIC
jgi:hypothetical protein